MEHSSPLTILHAIAGFRWTGVAEPVVQLARQQVLLGHRVLMAVEEGGDLAVRAREAGLEVLPGLVSHQSNPLSLWRQLDAWKRAVRAERPNILHAHLLHDHWLASLSRSAGGRGTSRPRVVRTFHREEDPRAEPWTKRLMRRGTDGYLAVSGSLAGRLTETYGQPSGGLLVEGGAVDAQAFAPGADPMVFRSECDIPAEAPVAGLLSRLREARGIFWLLDAVEPLLERVPGAYVVFCGRGRHADELRRRIEAHPCRDRIRYPGYVTPDRLCEAYAAFDVHCLLGPGNDGTCRAALQSMACERPLIAADMGALRDLLAPRGGEEMGGKLVAVNDRTALAEALAFYLRDRNGAHLAGRAARARMLDHYKPEDQARRVVAFYRELLAKA